MLEILHLTTCDHYLIIHSSSDTAILICCGLLEMCFVNSNTRINQLFIKHCHIKGITSCLWPKKNVVTFLFLFMYVVVYIFICNVCFNVWYKYFFFCFCIYLICVVLFSSGVNSQSKQIFCICLFIVFFIWLFYIYRFLFVASEFCIHSHIICNKRIIKNILSVLHICMLLKLL